MGSQSDRGARLTTASRHEESVQVARSEGSTTQADVRGYGAVSAEAAIAVFEPTAVTEARARTEAGGVAALDRRIDGIPGLPRVAASKALAAGHIAGHAGSA